MLLKARILQHLENEEFVEALELLKASGVDENSIILVYSAYNRWKKSTVPLSPALREKTVRNLTERIYLLAGIEKKQERITEATSGMALMTKIKSIFDQQPILELELLARRLYGLMNQHKLGSISAASLADGVKVIQQKVDLIAVRTLSVNQDFSKKTSEFKLPIHQSIDTIIGSKKDDKEFSDHLNLIDQLAKIKKQLMMGVISQSTYGNKLNEVEMKVLKILYNK